MIAAGTWLDDDAHEVRRGRATRLAEAALERYDLRGSNVRLLSKPGFKDVFLVSSPERGDFALRMYNVPRVGEEVLRSDPSLLAGPGLRSPNVLRSQMLWLQRLAEETSLLLPQPVPTSGGDLVGYVPARKGLKARLLARWSSKREAHDRGRYFVLLPWLPGEAAQDPSLEDPRRMGSSIAALHRQAERYTVPEDLAFPRWDWDWPFGESAPLWDTGPEIYSDAEMKVFETTARRVRRELSELGEGKESFGIIHRDLKPEHFVFHDGDVSLIDFDLAGWGYYLFDLAVPLLALKNRHGPRRADDAIRALLEGYRAVRPLPDGYERYLKTAVAMLTVATVNRSLRVLDHAGSEERSRRLRVLSNAPKRLADYDTAMNPIVGG